MYKVFSLNSNVKCTVLFSVYSVKFIVYSIEIKEWSVYIGYTVYRDADNRISVHRDTRDPGIIQLFGSVSNIIFMITNYLINLDIRA